MGGTRGGGVVGWLSASRNGAFELRGCGVALDDRVAGRVAGWRERWTECVEGLAQTTNDGGRDIDSICEVRAGLQPYLTP